MKKCRKCNILKQNDDFYKSRKTQDGLGIYCKICLKVKKRKCSKCKENKKIYSREKSLCFSCYKENSKPTKKCSICCEYNFLAVSTPPICFSCYDKYCRSGTCSRCGRKTKIKLKNNICQFCYHVSREGACDFCGGKTKRIAKYFDKKAMCISCYDGLPESRAKRFNKHHDASITPLEWKLLMDEFSWKCFYCDEKLTKEQRTIDHIVPKIKGGTNDLHNLVPCCRKCNGNKGGKSLLKWAEEIDLDQNRLNFLISRVEREDGKT